jgi:hypothetical protein
MSSYCICLIIVWSSHHTAQTFVFKLPVWSLQLDTSELLLANSGSMSFAECNVSLPCTCERFARDHFSLKNNNNVVFYVTNPYSFLGFRYVPCTLFADFYLFGQKVDQFKYLGRAHTIKIPFRKKIKSSLKLGNACYHSVQNLLSSRLLSKIIKINL